MILITILHSGNTTRGSKFISWKSEQGKGQSGYEVVTCFAIQDKE
jgi:hypothetical protein